MVSLLVRTPYSLFRILVTISFVIYKILHKKRAFGRVESHLERAKRFRSDKALQEATAAGIFRGIYWSAINSYRGLARIPATTLRVRIENDEIIQEAINKGPVVAFSIHQGPFELLHRTLCNYSENVHLVTDTLKEGALRKVIQDLRKDPHLTEYTPNETRQLVRDFLSPAPTGTRNRILAMVVDQGRDTKGNVVQLFGQSTTLYLRLPELLNDKGVGLVFFRAYLKSGKSVKGDKIDKSDREIVIRFEKYYEPHYNNTEKSGLVDAIAVDIENSIAMVPEQWSWNYHKNFLVTH